ncbi:hypothetical protein TC41_2868 [Alicyclobacillus acidocaldarius subsp. acidocaldarius Tc-4-1]|uniref:Uncharacterized protein n=1 Tax=Alicyclobacillus acidocaldarius (strain Tc-4-1) TaxID=1048834 RepID=F8IK53_ALIAT|nr:hypothetical protein TC41_2868 [Alicyclobacillus acidocaldarius subsp. acidocaldarius Tc-4-1]
MAFRHGFRGKQASLCQSGASFGAQRIWQARGSRLSIAKQTLS